ncbi:hypothetical protein SUDANB121_05798 [Nocardiopsis dassonvillei]
MSGLARLSPWRLTHQSSSLHWWTHHLPGRSGAPTPRRCPVRDPDTAPRKGRPMSTGAKNGLPALPTPRESAPVLIGHEPSTGVGNVVGPAGAARVFDVSATPTTVTEERGGRLVQALQDVFPEQEPIDRTLIDTGEDGRVVDAVGAPGRGKAGRPRPPDGDPRGRAGDPGGGRGLRGLRRHRRLGRCPGAGARHGRAAHDPGGRDPDRPDGLQPQHAGASGVACSGICDCQPAAPEASPDTAAERSMNRRTDRTGRARCPGRSTQEEDTWRSK